jgi:hypothetical protein
MRFALFALPAIAFGLIAVAPSPLNLVGFVLLGGWFVFELVMLRRRWWRRGFQPTAEIAAGVADLGRCSGCSALPKSGARWVRVGRSVPTVRAGGAQGQGRRLIELVLHPTSAATTIENPVARRESEIGTDRRSDRPVVPGLIQAS